MNLFFHYGALGDFVLTWPLLRRLEGPTTLITDWPRAVLASRSLDDVRPMDIGLWEFMRLHAEGGPTSVSPAVAELFGQAETVISFISTGEDHWAQNITRLAPQARIVYIDPRPPEGFDGHITDWHKSQAQNQDVALGDTFEPAFAGDPTGPIAIHPGSGGEQKCWPTDRFEQLLDALTRRGQPVAVLLGEAEAERWPHKVLEHWRSDYDAQLFGSLEDLHAGLARGSAYVGNDSGPTHLAAQLGLPTVALFGPTDPRLWAPVGPSVTVLAPPEPYVMDWLDTDTVLDACPRPG